jgi:hypothetical protein
MDFNLERTIDVLSRTPSTLKAMLSGLPNEWLRSNEGGETWSPYDVIGHLAFGEQTDWIERARIILHDGESRPFTPFDRFAQLELSKGKTIEALLDEFAELRRQNLQTLSEMNLQPEDLEKTGLHPALGRVMLKQLLATWMTHDLDHIAQIARIMAKQYATAVGPWTAYISVLHDRRPAS